MSEQAKLEIGGTVYQLPIVVGTEDEHAVDISKLRQESGCITLDDGYSNTGSCSSAITFIDGEKGILRYRGYPIEQLAESSTFLECAYLIIYGNLPTHTEQREFSANVLRQASIHESMRHLFEGFPHNSHPMAILSALLNSLGCYYPNLATNDRDQDLKNFDEAAGWRALEAGDDAARIELRAILAQMPALVLSPAALPSPFEFAVRYTA